MPRRRTSGRRWRRAAALFSEEDLTRFFQILLQTDDDLRRKPDPRVHLEMGMLRLINAGRMAPLEELLTEIKTGTVERRRLRRCGGLQRLVGATSIGNAHRYEVRFRPGRQPSLQTPQSCSIASAAELESNATLSRGAAPATMQANAAAAEARVETNSAPAASSAVQTAMTAMPGCVHRLRMARQRRATCMRAAISRRRQRAKSEETRRERSCVVKGSPSNKFRKSKRRYKKERNFSANCWSTPRDGN